MPKFVPVSNPEAPRSEQNLFSSENIKHRKFDNPHAVVKVKDDAPPNKRGWQQGTCGWGVLGSFGDDKKDEVAQILKVGEGSSKMVKNEKGLWVRAKTVEPEDQQKSSRGGGRGRGVPVLGPQSSSDLISGLRHSDSANDDEFDYMPRKSEPTSERSRGRRHSRSSSRRSSRSGSSYSSREPGRSRGRDRSRSRDRYGESRRHRSRSRSRSWRRSNRRSSPCRDRRDRSYSDERRRSKYSRNYDDASRSRYRRRDGGRSRSRSRSRSPETRDARRRRSRSRSRSSSRRRDARENPTCRSGEPGSRETRGQQHEEVMRDDSGAISKECVGKYSDTTVSDEAEGAQFDITAIQVVNRLLELYGSKSKTRLELIGELFQPECVVASLKTQKPLLTGAAAIQQSFARTSPQPAACHHRLFVLPATSSNQKQSSISFALDFYAKHQSPGLGDPSKDAVVLFRCEKAQVTHAWGAVTPADLAKLKTSFSMSCLTNTSVWEWIVPLVQKDFPEFGVEYKEMYLNDYENIETWG